MSDRAFSQQSARAEPAGDGWVDDSSLRSESRSDFDAEFEAMYRDHYAFVWRCARRMGASPEDLDDVLQDTFVAAYRRFDSWKRDARASTWLFAILRNVLRNRNRAGRRHARRLDALAQEPIRIAAGGDTLLAQRLLDGFLAELDESKRTVFVLAELEGMTATEIGRALAISPNTASSRLRAARKSFADHFEGDAGEQLAGARSEQPPAGRAERTLALVWAAPLHAAAAPSGALVGALGQFAVVKLALIAGVVAAAIVVVPRLDVDRGATPAIESGPVGDSQVRQVVDARQPGFEEPAIVVPAGPVRPSIEPQAAFDLTVHEGVREAREHLVAGRPQAALARLEQLDPSDPTLREARVATRIAALCQLGRSADAEASWETLQAATPESPLVATLAGSCWSR